MLKIVNIHTDKTKSKQKKIKRSLGFIKMDIPKSFFEPLSEEELSLWAINFYDKPIFKNPESIWPFTEPKMIR